MPERRNRRFSDIFKGTKQEVDPEELIQNAKRIQKERDELSRKRKLQIMAEREAAYMPPGVDLSQLWAEEEEKSGLVTILLIVLVVLQVLSIILGLFHI